MNTTSEQSYSWISRFAIEHIASLHDLQMIQEFPFDIWQKMNEAGFFKIGIAPEYGGSGGGILQLAGAGEVFVRSGYNMGLALSWLYQQIIAVNLISNPGFESGTSPWTFYTNGTGSYTVGTPAYAGTKSAKINLSTVGTNMQLYRTGISLEPNTRYRLSFAAYSSTGHDMKINLIKHISPYTNYGLTYVPNLTASWQTFATEFTTSGFTGNATDGRLQFYFPGFASANDVYYLDEIKIEKITTLGSIDLPDIPDVLPRSDIGRLGVIETPAMGSNSTFMDAIRNILNYINSAISR